MFQVKVIDRDHQVARHRNDDVGWRGCIHHQKQDPEDVEDWIGMVQVFEVTNEHHRNN